MKVSVVVPTYQERSNLEQLVGRTCRALGDFDHQIVVVDDDSPDGTGDVARDLARRYPVTVVERRGARGLGSAILEGFRQADGDVLGVIDADLQHPPEVMSQLAAAVQSGADIAIASRYATSGSAGDRPLPRRLVSWGATLLARPLTSVRDPMSGCFLLDGTVLDNVNVVPGGYKLLLEILVKGRYHRVEEVPYVFGTRANGRSKLGVGEGFRYLRLLLRLYLWRGHAEIGRLFGRNGGTPEPTGEE